MYNKTKINPAGRFVLLVLAFACGAVTVYSLRNLPSPARYLLTPADTGQVSFLTSCLAGFGIPHAETMLRAVSGIAVEMALWLLAGLTVCAGTMFAAASALRGACFGFVLSLAAENTASGIACRSFFPVIGWLAVTLLLFGFAANHTGQSVSRTLSRFLPTAGAAFWITFACSCLPLP